jgi:hypothetical protein
MGRRENRTASDGTSETDELLETAKSTISSLFRVAVMIRKASPRDRFARALATSESFDATFDIRHVRISTQAIVSYRKLWPTTWAYAKLVHGADIIPYP